VNLGKSTTETLEMLREAFGEHPWRPSLKNPWARRHCWDQLWSLPIDLNRKFEHALHCREVCSPNSCQMIKSSGAKTCLFSYERRLTRTQLLSLGSLTGDKSWIYSYDAETKQQLSQWKSPQPPRERERKKKACQGRS
jgi:hypothetical protein